MKRLAYAALVAGTLSAGFLLGQTTTNSDKWWTPAKDAVATAPQNHKLLFENDEVRVLGVDVPPSPCEPSVELKKAR